ncbi:MAG: outer membrane beta-barrel protein [Pseudomonadota bacterium]
MTKFYLTLILSVACNTALAAAKFPLGPFQLQVIPDIEVTLKYNNNVTLESHEETSSPVTILRPQVTLLSQQRTQSYSVSLGTQIGYYANSSVDDYLDLFLKGNANRQFGPAVNLSLNAAYMRGHDQRGSTDRGIHVGDQREPDTWDDFSVNGLLQYGRKDRIGFDAEIGYNTRSYDDFIYEEKMDDKNQTDLTGRAYYRILPKTRLFFEASYSMIKYQNPNPDARSDSDVSNYSVGATWTATAKTKGTVQVGYLTKEFDSSSDNFEKFTGTSWQIGVDWNPMPRSTVNFYTGRYTNDTTGIHSGGLQDTQDFSVNWTHNWRPRLSTKAGFYWAQTDYPGGLRKQIGLAERSDDTFNFDLGVNYQLLRWGNLTAGLTAGVSFTERDSNLDSDDYDQQIYYITFQAAFK